MRDTIRKQSKNNLIIFFKILLLLEPISAITGRFSIWPPMVRNRSKSFELFSSHIKCLGYHCNYIDEELKNQTKTSKLMIDFSSIFIHLVRYAWRQTLQCYVVISPHTKKEAKKPNERMVTNDPTLNHFLSKSMHSLCRVHGKFVVRRKQACAK